MKSLAKIALLIFGLCAPLAQAEVLVLVHGYLGAANSWDYTGVTAALQQDGWSRAGVYIAGPGGVRLIPAAGGKPARKFYAVDLPSEAPVLVQVYLLNDILASVAARHAGEPVVLVGHSVGGVVARAALVRGNHPQVRTLITIASPHLGTWRAEQALDVTDIPFPFSLITDFFGGEIYDTAMRSRSLYVDLVRPQPGSLLYWLNAQPHPDIRYISVVRADDGPGDYVVPAISQDMNNVPVLRGRSSVTTIPARHGLEPQDGAVLVKLLGRQR